MGKNTSFLHVAAWLW